MDVTRQAPGRRALNNVGFALMLLGCPALTWYVTIAIRHYDGALVLPDADFLARIEGPTLTSVGFYLAWLGLQLTYAVVLPGRIEHGAPLPDGRTLPYRLNGLSAFVLTLLTALGLVLGGVLPATFLFDQLGPLVTTANLVVLGLCALVHAFGRRQADASERLRNPLEAYVIGATLNPRTGSFDWKFFCESRPGMILWVLLDFSLAAAQHARHGQVSNAMLLVVAFQLLYVADYFVMEEAILSTWDIRHEPLGFMLCWGCLVWIPFTFSLQALYLVDHAQHLPALGAAALVLLNVAGYVIFRGANLQKHRFRKAPDATTIWGKPPRFIETARGTKLLTSGFWGLSRHSNYLGDLMMALAWCMTTGFARVVPYFYFVYFVILLVHRERRDNDHCAAKYGVDWDAYTRLVRWRIVPFVY